MTFERDVLPGNVIEGSIPIFNAGNEVASVKVSLADYLYNASGETFYSNPGSHLRSNAPWTHLSTELLKIPPCSQVNFYYKIVVPCDSLLQGTYWGLILIEPIDEVVNQGSKEEQSLDVQTVVRYGFQLITNIRGSGAYDLKVVSKELVRQDAKTLLVIDVLNTGTLVMEPKMHMEVFDLQGKCIKKAELCKRRIYPTCSVRYAPDISDLQPGKYMTLIVFDQGDKALFGTQYTLDIKDSES
ncbi:MAG: hypothetical protein P4L16_06330 [Chlamydiales bacterium]|nr:hypothetical protein [Chlamydiales bacterium]